MALGTTAAAAILTLTFTSCIVTAHGQGLTSCEYDADSCGCKTDKGLISLKKYGVKGLQYFDASSSAEYTWNPCKDVYVGSTTAACIQAFPPALSFDCGTHDSTTTSVKDGAATFNLRASFQDRESEIKCTCKSGETFSFVKEDPTGYYFLELAADACCPGGSAGGGDSEGLSAGSYLIIVFFTIVAVYAVVGVAYMSGVNHAVGKDRIPNLTFWTALPGLVRDGFKFTVSGGKTPSYSGV